MHSNAKRVIHVNALDDIHSGSECSQSKSQKPWIPLQVQTYYRITCGITSYRTTLCLPIR